MYEHCTEALTAVDTVYVYVYVYDRVHVHFAAFKNIKQLLQLPNVGVDPTSSYILLTYHTTKI